MATRGQAEAEPINPMIAFTDVLLNLVLILVFSIAVFTIIGQVGWEDVRYREAQLLLVDAVLRELPPEQQPYIDGGRHDPPGVQRWVFPSRLLFQNESTVLSEQGEQVLTGFARALRDNGSWRRIRIEGHSQPPLTVQDNDWELSAARAGSVARLFTGPGMIAPWFLAVSSRAGQDPINREDRTDPRNERVEILLEFSQGQTYSEVTRQGD